MNFLAIYFEKEEEKIRLYFNDENFDTICLYRYIKIHGASFVYIQTDKSSGKLNLIGIKVLQLLFDTMHVARREFEENLICLSGIRDRETRGNGVFALRDLLSRETRQNESIICCVVSLIEEE